MRYYRVAYVDPDWQQKGLTELMSGHPLYVHRPGQGAGRFDNPTHYAGLYMARQPYAAVGEVLGHLRSWPAREIGREIPLSDPTQPRSLVELDVDVDLIDLDNASTLDRLGWRPSDVVGRDRETTRAQALHQWLQRATTGSCGFAWWSYWRPSWDVAMVWNDERNAPFSSVQIVGHEPLGPVHPAVVTAANELKREIV